MFPIAERQFLEAKLLTFPPSAGSCRLTHEQAQGQVERRTDGRTDRQTGTHKQLNTHTHLYLCRYIHTHAHTYTHAPRKHIHTRKAQRNCTQAVCGCACWLESRNIEQTKVNKLLACFWFFIPSLIAPLLLIDGSMAHESFRLVTSADCLAPLSRACVRTQ